MSGKKEKPSRPAKTEVNLPEYDQRELQRQRDLVAQAKACGIAAKLAKAEMAKLNKEKSRLDKKNPDSAAISQEISQKIEAYKGVAMQECKSTQVYCMPTVDSKKIASPKSMGEELNKYYGTKIDFDQLSIFEGGEHTVAYIPWWPYLRNDAPKIKFYQGTKAKDTPRIAGEVGKKPNNKSGVTIGIGVDLGQDSADDFFEKMKRRNSGSQKMSDQELVELHEKIRPYFQIFGGEACHFLRENPLVLSAKQSHFLNKVAHDEALNGTIKEYALIANKNDGRKFTDLTVEQQTALFSNRYQRGEATLKLVKAIIHQNSREIPLDVREHAYLFASMNRKK
ncbi:MAG TPA: pesticin C-terminus-like muramidase [Telluria sp.]|jgi:ribosomal protein L9